MITWFLVVQLAMTGQHAAVPVPTEELCNRYLADIRNGIPMTITTKDGVVLPIACGPAMLVRLNKYAAANNVGRQEAIVELVELGLTHAERA